MTPELLQLQNILKKNKFSLTKQRQMLFECLHNSKPLTIGQLKSKINNKMDRASVYRTIFLFESLGIVQRIYTGWKYKLELTDKFANHHHHLICTKCGALTDISEERIESLMDRIADEYSFTPKRHQIEIQGMCSKCAN